MNDTNVGLGMVELPADEREVERLTRENIKLQIMLRMVSEGLVCRDDSTHYCPNCDQSLFKLKAAVDAVLYQPSARSAPGKT